MKSSSKGTNKLLREGIRAIGQIFSSAGSNNSQRTSEREVEAIREL